jgi:uncharacterized membrane protein
MNGDDVTHTHPQSTAKIGGHPVHPMLVPFPIVCFVLAFVVDIVFLNNNDPGWATASRWLLGAGLVMGALAAVAGLTDFMGSDRIRSMSDALQHMLANVTAVVLEIVNFIVRFNSDSAIGSIGVYLSGATVLILLFSGWKGGELVYRHGIGVIDGDSRN